MEQELELAGGSLYYIKHNDEITITRLQGLVSEVRIPEEIEGLTVTNIAKKAFLSRKNLRKVWLPKEITEIGDWAFAYCDNLEQVFLPEKEIRFGKAVFLECSRLRFLTIEGKEKAVAALLAAAVTTAQSSYLLDVMEAGSAEWLAKWDARMLTVLHGADNEGYSRQVLCGEEDYGSTDLDAFMSEKRKLKVRLLLLRLLYPIGLAETIKEEATAYLKAHTKGCESEETWQVILSEHGNDSAYFRLFAQLDCVNADNFDTLIMEIGEDYPEMKAFFMRHKAEDIGYTDFFAELEL